MKKNGITRAAARLLTAFLTSAVVFGGTAITALADSDGTVTVDNAKVRSDASTDAQTLSTLANGTRVTVTDEKSDSSGNVWYHVTLSDGTTGYIRSDLMTVTASADTSSDSDAADVSAQTDDTSIDTQAGGNIVNGIDVAAIVNPDGVTAIDLQSATINVATGKVRSDASTNDDIVAQLNQGTEVIISGSKLGSDSKTWYYVTFLDGGAQKTGYVRSDLVDMGDVIVLSTPEAAEPVDDYVDETYDEPVVNNDYELVYTDDGTGNNVWYLYNHIDNTREKLQELLDYADSQASKTAALTDSNKKLKIISIVLGALLAIALIAIIILVVKLNSEGYEYEDEDDDDDDEDDDEPKVSRRERRRSRRYEDDEDDEDEDEEDERPARTRNRKSASDDRTSRRSERDEEPAPAPKKTKPKNFMLDDDDFEFEFLNMDDK